MDLAVPNWKPVLEGGVAALRPTTEEDREAVFRAASDPLIWEQHSAHDRWQRGPFDKFFDDALACGGGLTILEKESGRVVGSTRYYDWSASDASVVIGYTFIERRLWGTGFNAEVKRLMIGHAFQWASTVWFQVSQGNVRSQRALAKIGATFDHQEDVLVSGVMSPRMIFRVVRGRLGI